MRRHIVAVIGAGKADPRVDAIAFEVGRLLGAAGCSMINGGLRGVMEASAAGFQAGARERPRQGRGWVIGVLPGSNVADANPHIDIPIATDLGEARNCVIVNTAEVCIAVGGEFGTLSEIALALRQGKTVISLSSWEVHETIQHADTPADAVQKALRLLA